MSALRRGAAIAAAGGGRPSATTHEPATRSSNSAEHLEYLASGKGYPLKSPTYQRESAKRPAARQNLEALRWQLKGVTSELDYARYDLAKLVADSEAASARVRLLKAHAEESAEEVHAEAEEAHRQQQHRLRQH